ncbi:MAG: iron-containing alcohol dehydrogenase [Candidatus Aminicenantes bacterium]|jgi:alcohol dehydrogenase
MKSVRYHVPTRIFFGPGVAANLKDIIDREVRAEKFFLVTDKGIIESGIADRIIAQLPGVTLFDEIEQNPKHPTIDRAGEEVRKIKPDLIIGLGGGSALDAAKAVALLATNPGKIEEYEGKEKYRHTPLPVLAVPTTCGTGSEVTWVSVVTHSGRQFKMSIKGPEMYPAAAVIDPDLLSTLPPHLVASTGLDALTHAVEAYTVKPATFLTDIFAREALGLIFHSIEDAYEDIKGKTRAREEIMKGSLLAGLAFGNSDVGSVHCLSEALGSLLDTPHGVANSVFLPFVMEFNLPAAEKKFAEIARMVGVTDQENTEAAAGLIRFIRILSRRLGIPSFRDTGVKEEQLSILAQKAFENNSNPSNPREATKDDYLEILKKAYLIF